MNPVGALFALAALWLAGSAATAADGTLAENSAPAGQAAPEKIDNVHKNQVLVSTTFSSGVAGFAFPSGYRPVDRPVRVLCPRKPRGNCTIEAEMIVQIRDSSLNNGHAVCAYVDGFRMDNPPCPELGTTPNFGFATAAFTQYKPGVRPGFHKVQTFVFSDHGVTAETYSIVYRVYKTKK